MIHDMEGVDVTVNYAGSSPLLQRLLDSIASTC